MTGFTGLVRRLFGHRPSGDGFTEITMPVVQHWSEPETPSLDVIIELPDGRSLPLAALIGREAEMIGPLDTARAAMATRDQRVGGIRLALSTDLVLRVAGLSLVTAPMFNAAAIGLREILSDLASATGDRCLYDNLDQGWALRLDARAAWLEVVEWDWEATGAPPRIAWRLPLDVLRGEAACTLARFDEVYAALVAATGEDWWRPRP
jgi:hypothetical protein